MEQRIKWKPLLSYTNVADVNNKARPNAAKELRMYLEEALSQAIEDWDADELETIADSFTLKQHEDNPDLLTNINKWKDRLVYFQLKDILKERVSKYAETCGITE